MIGTLLTIFLGWLLSLIIGCTQKDQSFKLNEAATIEQFDSSFTTKADLLNNMSPSLARKVENDADVVSIDMEKK